MTIWTIRLSAAAEKDFHTIVQWTAERFGPNQADTYANMMSDAMIALRAGPTVEILRLLHERMDLPRHLPPAH